MVVNPDEGMPDIEMYMEALASLGARHWHIFLLQVSVD